MTDGFLSSEMARHYSVGHESNRLIASVHGELERVRSQEIISRDLPGPPARVLDVGGAAGVYSLWLLDLGYEVHLVDALPLHVEQAQAAFERHANKSRSCAVVGDARRLDEPDSSVDVVLLLGPLYHLTERDDRMQALAEARRVLRGGGTLFAAAISRYASLFDGLSRNLIDDPAFCKILADDLNSGQHRNPANHPDYFTTAYFHEPAELSSEILAAGLELKALVGVEGPAWLLPQLSERWADPEKRSRLLELLRCVETAPSLLGASAHLIAIGKKR